MSFHLTFWDIGLWIAVIAIILLATWEVLSPYHGETGILIEENRLKMVALFFGLLFMLIVLIQVYQIITLP